MTILSQIEEELRLVGLQVAEIKTDMFTDEPSQEVYEVFRVELLNIIDDYSELLKTEKFIKNKLNLYDSNIILELLWKMKK